MMIQTEFRDDDLAAYAVTGCLPLPEPLTAGLVENDGACIWYSVHGQGSPIVLLHGGLGHSGNWGFQLSALMESGHSVILIDSRGHGRSTCDQKPYSYELMMSDVVAVMDFLQVEKAAHVGWSDGACTALLLAAKYPERSSGVFFFACNMDPSGIKPFEQTPALKRCFAQHRADYEKLSPTPLGFERLVQDVGLMQRTQPNYSKEDLALISVPVTVALGDRDEFIRREHAIYLANSIPGASFLLLEDVSHFAPWQRPEYFNDILVTFLTRMQA